MARYELYERRVCECNSGFVMAYEPTDQTVIASSFEDAIKKFCLICTFTECKSDKRVEYRSVSAMTRADGGGVELWYRYIRMI